jgi:hypothetical protein
MAQCGARCADCEWSLDRLVLNPVDVEEEWSVCRGSADSTLPVRVSHLLELMRRCLQPAPIDTPPATVSLDSGVVVDSDAII